MESNVTTQSYHVSLEKFEGPLDLLLDLIEDEELDITQISMATVTDQYLQHVEELEEVQPENIVDFLVMASQLLVIKSKALLPLLVLEEEEEIDARELEFRLKQLKIFRDYAAKLEDRMDLGLVLRQKRFVFTAQTQFAPPPNVTADDFTGVLKQLLEELPEEEFLLEEETITEQVSTEEKYEQIHHNLKKVQNIQFNELIRDKSSRTEVIVTFLAMLELLKQRIITADQQDLFGDITLQEHNE